MTLVSSEQGMTLIELLVALVLLGIMAGIVGLTFHGGGRPPEVEESAARVAAARRSALELRQPISITLPIDGRAQAATALPDGSVLADPELAIDRLTGRSRHGR